MTYEYKLEASDEDISGDHLLAEARVSLVKIFPQMQKQFQVLATMMVMVMVMKMMMMMEEEGRDDDGTGFNTAFPGLPSPTNS